jgi:hypothetical protein
LNTLSRASRFLGGVAFYLITSSDAFTQSVSGRIVDENNQPVQFANIFIQETSTGVSADEKGNYFISIEPGLYHFVITSIGYESKRFEIQVPDKPMKKDLVIQSSSIQLNEVEVKVRRRDPAYEIIKHVIDNKEKFRSQVESSRTQVYVKASEIVDHKKKKEKLIEEDKEKKEGEPVDLFEAERKKEEARLSGINLVEMQLTLNYQFPDRYKEERNAYKRYGSSAGLFIPVFSQTDFNFYYNLVHLKGISEVPLISPISKTAIISYKYKLEQTLNEYGQVVYKIRVTPRKVGEATASGYLFINDSTWNINRLELTMHKGGLKFFDDFTIKQEYKEVEKDLWIPHKQEFIYQTKSGAKTFRGNTLLVYANFENNYPFPPRFFGNEVAVTTAEAYKRDSSFWNNSRPEPLTDDQKKMVAYRDSLEAMVNSDKYKDSLQAKFNKVTVGELLYHGVGFRNHRRKEDLYISSLVNLLDFAVVGGFRLGPYIGYFRRFKNERWIATNASAHIGVKNLDWQGGYSIRTLYNPYRLGWAGISFGRQFQSINNFDAYLNQLRISNYILHDYVDIYHRKELFNGFYLTADVGFANRSSVAGYDATSVLNEILDEGTALEFKGYQAVISNLRFSYTPFQKYMREPNRKVVLGSTFPTFHFNHRRGWANIFSSDVNFDYVDVMVDQNVSLGTLGTSKYSMQFGKFVNAKVLPYVDLKRFRQSDPYLYSDPMHSFQLLDTSMYTTDWFFEFHYLHYFNGAMINNIPLVKKLRLRTVVGGGVMWVRDNKFRHGEIFGGVERIFKVGPRRRLKLGAYGVLAESNFATPQAGWKFSIDLIDTWKRDWSY